jgi:glycosyltransferase involved in cell wall biosynthesis
MSGLFSRFPDLSLIVKFNPKMQEAAGFQPEGLLGELDRLGFSLFLLDDERCRPVRVKADADWHKFVRADGYTNLYCVRREAALSIAFFAHSSELGGAERSLLQLVDELIADYGAICTVVLPGKGPLVEAMERSGAACLLTEYGWWGLPPGEPSSPGDWSALQPHMQGLLSDVLPELLDLDPDVIWTQSVVIPWGALAAGLLAKPHVWSVCEYGELDHGFRFFAPFADICQSILSSSAFVYTAIKDIGETLFPAAPPGTWRVLYRNLEVPEPPANPKPTGLYQRQGAVRLGMFATLSEGKGQEDAIRALAKLVAEEKDVELLLAGYRGPDYWLRLQGLVAELHVAEYVRAPGFLADPLAAMRETDIILVCSRREAFGRVALEAMRLGKPVVYAAAGGMLEYMVDGQTGLAYPPGNIQALTQALRRLITDEPLRARLGDQGRRYAQERFNRQSYGGEVYHQLIHLRAREGLFGGRSRLLTELLLGSLNRLSNKCNRLSNKCGELRSRMDALQQTSGQQALEIQELEAVLREQEEARASLELSLAERKEEATRLSQELARQHALRKPPSAWRKIAAKHARSLKKRRAEARELWMRVAVRLHWSESLRHLRQQCKLIRESQLLEENWYRTKYSELVTSRTDPVLHFLRYGAAQWCDPNQLFDTRWYLEQNPDVAAAGINPLIHYIQAGWKEGRQPNIHFHPRLYLEANPDVAAGGLEPLAHYLRVGIKERRPWQPSTMLSFTRDPEDTTKWPAPDVRLLAFYLPQFHSIPENDSWWGKGFTEWTNVRRGKPQFPGHYQPHVPHPEVGYYDLNEPDVMERQAELARKFGIHGFCFHHYWFAGKRLLEMPVERMLRTGKPDFPFCLCWANENWTRRWDGMHNEILIAQEHSPEDDVLFIRDVVRIMRDRRYIRIQGRPLLLIYRPLLLPDPAATFSHWRHVCRAKGVGQVFLAGVQGFGFSDPRTLGLDAAIEFPPHGAELKSLSVAEHEAARHFAGQLYDYQQLQLSMQSRRLQEYRLFRGIMPSWDNTARRLEKGTVFVNTGPQDYYLWLSHIVRETRARYKGDERLVFINAWNEWAEGCHLEPDERHGFAWLNATRRALLPAGLQVRAAAVEQKKMAAIPAPILAPEPPPTNDASLLVIGHDACRAGAQHVLLSLLREWRRQDRFSLRLLLVKDGVLRRDFEQVCPTLVLTDFSMLPGRKAALERFLASRPQLIYSNTVVNGPLLEELGWLNCPIVTHVHELQKSIERWAPGEIMAATLRRTNHFIAVSEPVAENLKARHGVAAEAITVIHAFIDIGSETRTTSAVAARRRELQLNPEHIVVFGCGTTDWRKGPDLFVEIAAQACATLPQLRFLWIGAGSHEERSALDKLIARRGLRDRVRFLGERSDARGYLAAGDIFLLSSREDPFPLVALEAADAGLPIICFDGAGGMPGFVGQECGRSVALENIDATATAIRELATDEALRRRLGAQAKAKVARCHSTAHAAAQIAALLEQVRKTTAASQAEEAAAAPLVSVIVPAYNHARFLPARLDSVRCQNLPNMEILLLDDASDDESLRLLEHFAQTEPRAKVLRNGSNSGSTFKQWKKGLAAARGKYIWLAESDDWAAPGLLSTLVQKLEANPKLALAYVQSQMIDEEGRHLGLPLAWTDDISLTRWRSDYVTNGRTELREALSIKNTIPNASAVVLRNFNGIAELVDDAMRLCADWLFWVRLCGRGDVAFHSAPLNYWRQNSSHARTDLPGVLEWQEGQHVIQAAAELLEMSPSETRRLLEAFESRCQAWLARARAETSEPVPA